MVAWWASGAGLRNKMLLGELDELGCMLKYFWFSWVTW